MWMRLTIINLIKALKAESTLSGHGKPGLADVDGWAYNNNNLMVDKETCMLLQYINKPSKFLSFLINSEVNEV